MNVSRHWVIPKPSWIVSRRATIAPVSAIVAAPIVAFGIPNPLDLTGMPFLGLFGALGTASIVASLLLRQVLHPEGDPLATCDASDPLEVALVGDEGDRLRFAAAAVATLGMPSTDPQAEGKEGAAPSTIVIRSPPPGSSPTVAALHARLSALGACTPVEAVKAAADAAREEFEPRLVERGLLVGPWWRTPAPWVILLPMFATLALGIAKIFVGVSREKPVGFLVFSCLVLTAVSVLMIAKKPRRTRQGDRFVRKAWQQFRESGQEQAWRKRVDAEAITPMAVALLGAMTLGWTPHAFVKDAVNTIRSKDGAGGGGGCGSAGSGCGGGGCGGCGGCGGGGD